MLPCSRVPLAKKSGPQAGLANINRSLRGVAVNHEDLKMKLTITCTISPSHFEITGLYLLDKVRSIVGNTNLEDVVQYVYPQLGKEVEVSEDIARKSGVFWVQRKFYCQITIPREKIPDLLELKKVEITENGLKPIMEIPDKWFIETIQEHNWAKEIVLNSDDDEL